MQININHFLRRFVSGVALLSALTAGPAFADSYEDALSSARLGDTHQLVGLLERGVSPDTVDDKGNTLLILAAMEGHSKTVQALLKFRPNVSLRNTAGDSALMMAALKGNLEITDILLDAGAPVNHEGWTPLLYAAFEGHLNVVERLLERGADVDALSPNKSNALMVAARNGHINVVRRLLKTDINLNQLNDRGISADSWARSNGNTDIADLIAQTRKERGLGTADPAQQRSQERRDQSPPRSVTVEIN